MVKVIAAMAVTFVLGACGGDGNGDVATEESPGFRDSSAVIETDDGSVLVNVEVADTPEEHAVGLMHRESLDADAGMVFVFFEDTAQGFWMKNTLIPLSIAFFNERGEIVRIMDMEPCDADPCPVYDPETTYRGALEVNRGAFAEWGVERGDVIRISP